MQELLYRVLYSFFDRDNFRYLYIPSVYAYVIGLRSLQIQFLHLTSFKLHQTFRGGSRIPSQYSVRVSYHTAQQKPFNDKLSLFTFLSDIYFVELNNMLISCDCDQ